MYHLPDLSHLSRTNLADRVLNMIFGMGAYPVPTQFQVTTAMRLVDKALTEWDAARDELAKHAESGRHLTQALFRAISHLETVVDSLARLLHFVRPLEQYSALQEFGHMPLPDPSERTSIWDFRNQIAHGDKEIAKGSGRPGQATATLRPDSTGIELQAERLEYSDLARILEEIHNYLRAVAERTARSGESGA
jgi:hypothetical protein